MAVDLSDTKSDQSARSAHVEAAGGLDDDAAAFQANFSECQRKTVLRKIDVRLVPLLGLVYLRPFIDRANIGDAKIEGLLTDLNLTNPQYNIYLFIFFVPYVPSNYVLNRFTRPSRYVGTIIMAWGVVMTLEGVVQNFAGLAALRVLLEAGLFPGAVLIISKWYLPHETQTRIVCFYSFSALAGAISGLLAARIAQMKGVGGLEPWRWIFILEGIATFRSGVLLFFFLIDSPALRKGVDTQILWSVLTDWQIYLQALIYWSNTVPNNALKFTMPTINENMGYESTAAQLLAIPPYVIGAISAFTASIFADRYRWRMPFIVGPQVLVVVAYAVLMTKASDIKYNMGVCYFVVVLACSGLYPVNLGGNSWTLSNLAGPTKRAMGIVFMVCMGNAGGIVGSYIFMINEAPGYVTGFSTSLAFAAADVVACGILELAYTALNKRRDKLDQGVLDQYTPEMLDRLGNRASTFRYSLLLCCSYLA
ncbi:hypothetical protein BDW74DRAFT_168462 [Aspergillus multicolor]|uniref:uncharacterized protein n=1 Tax=Aspergillus multicolor TaxID=41759 RepID=UPI003CCC9AFA